MGSVRFYSKLNVLRIDEFVFVQLSFSYPRSGKFVCLLEINELTINLLTTTIVAPPSNASKWQMGFNSAFKGLSNRFIKLIVIRDDGPIRPETDGS